MQINKFDDFAQISLSTYNLKNLNIDKKKASAALSNEIESEYKELNSEKVKTGRCNFFKIPDTEKEHYQEHLINISDNKKIICGIRHFGGKSDKPFLNILTNFTTTKKELLEIYSSSLYKHFELFNPKYLRYYTQQKVLSNKTSNAYLVQNAAIIKSEVLYEKEKDLHLTTPENDYYYKNYINEYEKFYTINPNLKNKVPYNSMELMEASRKDGLLKEVTYKGEQVGIIAALKDDFLGHNGIYFIDILVKEDWKRKGLAKAIQRKFINETCKKDEVIWGTIDMDNKPSLMTAKANLRREIRYENFALIKNDKN